MKTKILYFFFIHENIIEYILFIHTITGAYETMHVKDEDQIHNCSNH